MLRNPSSAKLATVVFGRSAAKVPAVLSAPTAKDCRGTRRTHAGRGSCICLGWCLAEDCHWRDPRHHGPFRIRRVDDLAHEPFSACEPLIRHQKQNEFLQLQQRLYRTIVPIKHDSPLALRMAGRVRAGRDNFVIQTGAAEESATRPADAAYELSPDMHPSPILTKEAVRAELRVPNKQNN